MSISAESVRFDQGEGRPGNRPVDGFSPERAEPRMWVGLSDGRVLGVPLAWFPRLLHADPAEREAVEITPFGLHWEALDEDVSVAGFLAGRGDQRGVGRVA